MRYLSINSGAGLTIQTLSQAIPLFQGLNFNYSESINQSNVPLYLKFSFPFKNGIIPAIYAGAELVNLNSANYSYNYSSTDQFNEDLVFLLNRKKESVKIQTETDRNEYRKAAIVGARVSYQLKKINFYVDFRYKKELDLYNNPDKHFVEKDLYITNSYVLPDIYLETYEMSLGFVFNFAYKAKSKY